jgi:hypothetical protein
MRPLPFRIGPRDQRTRLAKPEAQLPKQILALAHSQVDCPALLHPGTEHLAIPKVGAQALLPGRLPQGLLHRLELVCIEPPRTPRAFRLP